MHEITDIHKAAEKFTSRVRDLVEVLPRDDLAGQALGVELEAAHRRFVEAWKSWAAAEKKSSAAWEELEKPIQDCLHLIELLWRTQMLHPPRVLQILAHGKAFAEALAKFREQATSRTRTTTTRRRRTQRAA